MSYNYAVTAYKPTSVTAVLTGNFTGEKALNLILVKGSNLVVHVVTPEGLKSVLDLNIRGRISVAKLIRPKGEKKDLLVFLTAQYYLAVVAYNPDTGEVVNRACGNIRDRIGRPCEGEMLGAVDPACTVMAFHLYSGLLKVVPLKLDSGEKLTAFNCRLEDLCVINMVFLHGYEQPTIAYLAEEENGRKLKTKCIAVKEKELVKGPWEKFVVESQASLLHAMPLPLGGVVVIGSETISYYNKQEEDKFSIDPARMKEAMVSCVGLVDDSRCLLGDVYGKLFMLFVEKEERMGEEERAVVTGLRLEVLGETVSPSSLAYLDNGVVFVGSHFGDSQLIRLSTKPDESGSFVQVMEQFTNLGPILDMAVVDLDKQGQDLIVSCSGYGKDGSLRVVKSGIGINELASIDLPAIKGIWSLHCGSSTDSDLHNTLVVSFVGHTTVLSLCGEEVEETEIEGLSSDKQTFHCANVIGKKVIQVTSQSVRLINEEDMKLICKWEPPDGKNISSVSCNWSQVMVAVGRDLYYLEIEQGELNMISHVTMSHEVACVDISPLGGGGGGAEHRKAELCAIGLWTEISVAILKLPSLERVDNQLLGGDIIPRSVLLVTFGDTHYLLCALGDGCLLYYQIQLPAGQLSASKRVVLGTKPIVLKQFNSSGSVNVFACSNHPTIIYTSNQKLLFSNVNLKEVNYLCSLNSDAFRDSLAMVDDSTLTIGSVDQIQMLHIQTIPLGETARRIAYQEETNTFAALSCRIDLQKEGVYSPMRQSVSTTLSNLTMSAPCDDLTVSKYDLQPEIEVSTIILLDQTSFEATHGYQLLRAEQGVSITTCTLGPTSPGADPKANIYYVVGTAIISPNEKEPQNGRILVFQVTANNTLQLVHQMLKTGPVYQVASFKGMLAATIGNTVEILRWNEEERALQLLCDYSNNIMALYLKTHGDFLLVGDLMRSFRLLVYKSEEGHKLEEIAVDISLNPVFLMAIDMIDDETYVGADGRHIFLCQKNSVATVEEDLRYMQQPARMYIGESINVFGRGSLVMEHPGSSPLPIIGKPILYGGVHGTIGLIGQLKPEVFSLLMKLQNKMTSVVKSIGNIDHEDYRSFFNEHTTKIAEGFIDGDLVEQFLDLSQNDMTEICKGIKMVNGQGSEVEVQVEEVVKLVEDLSRLH